MEKALKKRRGRWKEGDVVQIDLDNGQMSFARVLRDPLIAFYDLIATEVPSIEQIVASPITFKLWVMRHALTAGIWPRIGHVELSPELREPTVFFKQDPLSGRLSIYLGDGVEVPATIEEASGLECAAVWDPEHIVDRLRDHFAGQPNKWVEMMKPKSMGRSG
jgi:hypothetical protein